MATAGRAQRTDSPNSCRPSSFRLDCVRPYACSRPIECREEEAEEKTIELAYEIRSGCAWRARIGYLQCIRARILFANGVAVVGPQDHKRRFQLAWYGAVRRHQANFDQLRLQHRPAHGRLNDIRSVQAVHTIHPEHGILVANGALSIAPIESHFNDFGGQRLDQCRHILETHAAAAKCSWNH